MTTVANHNNNNNNHSPSATTPPSNLTTPPLKMPIITSAPPTAPSVIKPLVHPLFPTSPGVPPETSVPAPVTPPVAGTPPNLEQLRLQQLYTLALAERMRFLPAPNLLSPYAAAQNSGAGHPALPHLPPRGFPSPLPPPEFSHPLYPYGKFDPRLFRLPEEPKPQHSYIGLISMAILSSTDQKLVLADIYQYILDNFPYFRHRGPGWRNSIRHNLSLNECFVKAGRAANGKGHYWAIHPACIEDFKKGDYRRRKAQRQVRKFKGLGTDEEDSPSPPPPPALSSPLLPHGWPPFMAATLGLPGHPGHHLPHLPLPPPSALSVTSPRPLRHLNLSAETPTLPAKRRQFDVASLLGQTLAASEANKEDEKEAEQKTQQPRSLFSPFISSSSPTFGEAKPEASNDDLDVVSTSGENMINSNSNTQNNSDKDSEGEEDMEETASNNEEEESERAKSRSPQNSVLGDASSSNNPGLPAGFPWALLPPAEPSGEPRSPTPLAPHEYLARYYHLMQQNHQQRLLRETLAEKSEFRSAAFAANGGALAKGDE